MVVIFTLVVVWLIFDYNAYPSLAGTDAQSFNRGENGLWLRYTWYFGDYKPTDVATLCARLKSAQVKYAYFHVRYADSSGRLHFHYPDQARALNSAVHRSALGVDSIAWVYIGKQHGHGGVNLENPAVRKGLVGEAVWLAKDCGFDGVQWDYEICDDRDKGFLSLLAETRAALPKGKMISVAAPVWLPPPFTGLSWSQSYFGQVAARCDQIVVMAYDTGVYFPRAYSTVIDLQIRTVSPVVSKANPQCRLIVGLPTYKHGTLSHNPTAENLSVGLDAVREALESNPVDRPTVAGVAVFADYTTTQQDWNTYAKLWAITTKQQ